MHLQCYGLFLLLGGREQGQGKKKDKKRNMFEEYWETVKLQQGLKRGELIQGPVRINPKSYQDAYVPHPVSENQSQDSDNSRQL